MKILHVISGIDRRGGGPATALIGLTQALAAQGADVTVAATWCQGDDLSAAEDLQKHGIHVELIGPCRRPLARHPQIKHLLKTLIAQADIVHIHALWEEIQHQAARVAYQLRVPYIITPHGMLDPWSLTQSKLKKKLYMAWRLRKNLNRAAAIHFTSNTERDQARSLTLSPQSIVKPIGIDLTEFENPPPAGTFRDRYPAISNRPLIVFLGRIHPGKGLEYLIPAMAKVRPDNTVLAVVGPDSNGYQTEMETLVAKHRLEQRVIFTGMLTGTDRVAALADADLFALPSDHENFGVAVIEALAVGTPVVISDQVYIHYMIAKAGVGGVIPADSDALAEELERWLLDDSLRCHAGSHSRAFVREHYDWGNIAQHWLKSYVRLRTASGLKPCADRID